MNKYYTVGIVEDEVIERQALRMIIKENRPVLQVVFEAGDGNSALEMAKQYRPDILIVDIQIPERTGLELCQELRQEGYEGLIIISTSYSIFQYAYLAIKLNVVDYLLKPTGEAQILSVLDRCILILEKTEKRKEKEQRLEEHMIQTRYEADRGLLQWMMDGNKQVFPRLEEIGFPENGQWQACWIVQAWSMAEKMDTKYAKQLKTWGIEEIIPIPLHRVRRRKRGFNQSKLLAEQLAQKTGIPINRNVLYRIRNTKPLKEMDGKERRRNLQGAFGVSSAWKPCRNVLLIDDIYTTGSTIEQAAKLLRKAGAQNVYFNGKHWTRKMSI